MSIELKGNLKKGFNTSNIKISGQEPTLAYVSVDVIGDVNRDTKASLISKYLKDGWQWSLFTPIAVAQFPEGSGIPDKLLMAITAVTCIAWLFLTRKQSLL